VDDPDLRQRLGAAARKRIEENFTWRAVARRYVEEYQRHARPNTEPGLRAALVHGNGNRHSVEGELAAVPGKMPVSVATGSRSQGPVRAS
jgi:hypothetical protein